jgi:flavin-dependent dehydrogenase
VGDAAAVLDPASSHGVLRALMGGMMAAHVMSKTVSGDCDEATAYETYSTWVRTQFEHDFKALQEFYTQHPAWSFLKTTSSLNEAI